MTALERPLDTVEAVFAAGARHDTCGAAVLLGVSGDLGVDACARAVHSLPARHPRLRTRVAARDGGFAFTCEGVTPPPFRVADPASPEDWPRLLEDALRRRMDEALPALAGVTLVPARRAGESHAVILWGQHAALDFQSMLTLAEDVIAASAGDAPAVREAALPLDARLPPVPEGAVPRAPPAPIDPVMLPFAARAPIAERRERFLLHVVPRSTARALLESARAARATLTGIVAAAALEAVRRTWGPLPAVRMATSVSARRLSDPPVAPGEVGCFVSLLESVVPLRDEIALWDHARAHSADIRARIDAGEWNARLRALAGRAGTFERQVAALAHDEASQGRATTIDIVNFGVLDLAPAPPFRVGPVYAGVSNQGIGHCLWLGFGTIDGELHVSFTYVSPLVDEGRAQDFLHAFDRLLATAADQSSTNR